VKFLVMTEGKVVSDSEIWELTQSNDSSIMA
jgi:hypothetical protein